MFHTNCFFNKIRTSPPTPVVFQFDQTLIEDKDTLGKLQPNTLTVDNLTVDWLRNRLTELETSVKECQEKQSKMQLENGTSAPISTQSPLTNGVGRKENNKFVFIFLLILEQIISQLKFENEIRNFVFHFGNGF